MGVHSGLFGVVNGRNTVRQWSIEDTQAAQKYVASNTKAGSGRRRGVRDWTGSFQQYGHTPIVMPGYTFAFQGFTAPDNDQQAGTGTIYSGTAMVTQVVVTWNWGSGEIINIQTDFGGHLTLTRSDGQAALSDLTTPVVPQICGTQIRVISVKDDTPADVEGSLGDASDSGAGGEDQWPNLETATLTITSDVKTYVNSSTGCWTGRTRGPIDFTLAVVEQETKRSGGIHNAIQIEESLELKCFVTEDLYWHLKWAHIEGFTGISVNPETGDIISRTVNMGMDGIDPDGAKGTGFIKTPGGATFWPLAS
jgi:hypothetical protein